MKMTNFGKHDWVISQRSGIVGAIAFIVVDIFFLWCIHRGLMALQAYRIIRKVRNNRPVRLRRSSIPIVAGELHEVSASWWSFNLFVLANLASIVIAFIISMGINGEAIQVNVPMTENPLMYQTALSDGSKDSFPLPRVSQCRRETRKSTTYYPVAFNTTKDVRSFECQWEASPLLSIITCPTRTEGSSDINNSTAVIFYNRTDTIKKYGKSHLSARWFQKNVSRLRFERIRTVKKAIPENGLLRIGDRFHCATPTDVGYFNCVVLRDTNRTAEYLIAYGFMYNHHPNWGVDREELGVYEFRIQSGFGTIFNLSQVHIRPNFIFNAIRSTAKEVPYSVVDIADRLIYYNYIQKRVKNPTREIDLDVTVLKPQAWVSSIIVMVLAFLLLPCQEILTYFSKLYYGEDLSKLMSANRYDGIATWLPDCLSPQSLRDPSKNSQFPFIGKKVCDQQEPGSESD